MDIEKYKAFMAVHLNYIEQQNQVYGDICHVVEELKRVTNNEMDAAGDAISYERTLYGRSWVRCRSFDINFEDHIPEVIFTDYDGDLIHRIHITEELVAPGGIEAYAKNYVKDMVDQVEKSKNRELAKKQAEIQKLEEQITRIKEGLGK